MTLIVPARLAGVLALLALLLGGGQGFAAEEANMNTSVAERLFGQSPRQLREELQHGRSGDMTRRRAIVVLALVAMASMTVVTLFQTGVIGHMPDPPGVWFDSAKVNSSEQAYRFGLPDGAFVLVSLGITIVLAAFGGLDRAAQHAWIPIVFTAKAGVDAFFSGLYLWNMITVQKVACLYCIVTALATFAILALTLPELTHAIAQFGSREQRAATP